MLLELSMFPTDKGESQGDAVANIIEVVDDSGVRYQLTSMGTIMEGDWGQLMGIVKKCFDRVSHDCHRISCNMKIDWRRGKINQIEHKVKAIETRLGRELSK